MSNFIVPNTFVPGTKARAQDVNENFVAVQDELNLKAEKNGDETQTFYVANATHDNEAVNKAQLDTAINESNNDKVTHTENSPVGSSTRPVYINASGEAIACNGLDSNIRCTSRTTISSTKPDVIIAQYQSGTSGYRVWASGFKEKWGRISVSSNTSDVAVTFNTTYPFTTTPVVLTTVVGDNAFQTNSASVGGALIQAYAGNINRVSTTGFNFSYCYKGTTNVNTHNYSWYACGY